MNEELILSIDELAPPPPRYVEVFGARYQLVDPESLDLMAISRMEWIARIVRGRREELPFDDSRSFARAVRDLLVPGLGDEEIDRMTPTQAFGFASNLVTWALTELGKQLPEPPIMLAANSTLASSSPGSNGSTGVRQKAG
jgi:hypothetical protein